MIRKAFRMSVHPHVHVEYERRHNQIPDELARVLTDHGVRSYSIFLDDETGDLFAYAEIDDEAQWDAIASTPECRRWWAFMADVMPTNDDDSPRTAPLREVFHLD